MTLDKATQLMYTSRLQRREHLLREADRTKISHSEIASPHGALALWSMPAQGGATHPLILLHGGTYSSMSVFHSGTADPAGLSLLCALAERGVPVFALDFIGYGLSAWTDRHIEFEGYLAQVRAVVDHVIEITGKAPVLAGWSWGAQVAAGAAAKDRRLLGLVFWGGVWGGGGLPQYYSGLVMPDTVRKVNTEQHAASDFKNQSNFSNSIRQFFVQRALFIDESSPTDSRRLAFGAAKANRPWFEASEIVAPTLVIHGVGDHVIDANDQLGLVSALAARKKNYYVVPGADHNVQHGHGRKKLAQVISAFVAACSGT